MAERFEVHLGDCLQVLRGMPDNSVDAVVTDPPYGLGKEPDALAMLADWITTGHHEVKGAGFMGKAWDAFVPQPVLWAEVYRVLKPGGHVVAFAGTRTQDLMALGLRLAGFEIRDLLAWVYGSGFPKSLDVSKAIDKRKDWSGLEELQRSVRSAREALGISQSEAARRIGMIAEGETLGGGGFMWFETGKRLPTREQYLRLKSALQLGDECDEAFEAAEREVVGSAEMRDTSKLSIATAADAAGHDASARRVVNITAPATDAARAWQGWGTALKPALEPITLARKPLDGTVAANVLKWRTGAVNVDGCRIHSDDAKGGEYTVKRFKPGATLQAEGGTWKGDGEDYVGTMKPGRWPANLLHDGSDEVLAGFPTDGEQSAARFFYCAKASKRDRDVGNIHPTVKPTDLMRWLCRLITPPGGLILDPFTGSGSTGKAAMREGFRFLGCELDPQYREIAVARIAAALAEAEPEPEPAADNDNTVAADLLAWGGIK